MITIYKITHKETQKCYIGQAQDVQKRWRNHCTPSSGCKKISRAIQKYGKDAFEFKVLFECEPEVADSLETQCIWWYGTVKNGYNICPEGGSRRGVKHSDETKQKISTANQNFSEEARKKMSESKTGELNPMFGKKHSEEARKKMSGENNHRFGKKLSEETRRKMSESKSKLSNAQRDEIITLYATGDCSMKKIGEMFGVSHMTIWRIIKEVKG